MEDLKHRQCEYVHDGTDTDGTEWYECIIHGFLTMGEPPVCEGYEPPPFIPTNPERT